MIILNELKYAEEILATRTYDGKITSAIGILAKYYLHHMNYSSEMTKSLLNEFLAKEIVDYSPAGWIDTIHKTVLYANKNTLLTIDAISITKNELDTLNTIQSKPLQRLAFSLLCYAKTYNMINPNNNNWTNVKQKLVFTSANITKTIDGQNTMLHELSKLGLISFSKKISNLNIQVNFIDYTSDVELYISDFRNLGYEFLLYKGERYIRCCKCLSLTKNNKFGNKKYCTSCSKCEKLSRDVKVAICISCNQEFILYNKNTKTERCSDCYKEYRREYLRIKKQQERIIK